jgi:hypothetical protein
LPEPSLQRRPFSTPSGSAIQPSWSVASSFSRYTKSASG